MIYQKLIDQAQYLNLAGSTPFTHEQILATLGSHVRDIPHRSDMFMLRVFDGGTVAYSKCGKYFVGDKEVADDLAHYKIIVEGDDASGTAFKGKDYEGNNWYWGIGRRPTMSPVPCAITLDQMSALCDQKSESADKRNRPNEDALDFIVRDRTKIEDATESVILDPGDVITVWTNKKKRTFAYVPDVDTTVELDDRTIKRLQKRTYIVEDLTIAFAPIQGSNIYAAKVVNSIGEAKRFGSRQARGGMSGKIPVAVLTLSSSDLLAEGLTAEQLPNIEPSTYKTLLSKAKKKSYTNVVIRQRITKDRELNVNIPKHIKKPVYASNAGEILEQFMVSIQYDGINVDKAKSPAKFTVDKDITLPELKLMLKGLGARFSEEYVGARLHIKITKQSGKIKGIVTASVEQTPEANERTLRLIDLGIEGRNAAFIDHNGDTFVAEKINYLEGSVTGSCVTRSGKTTTTELYEVNSQRRIL